MVHNGLAKLVEECGEVAQVAGKLIAFPTGHPDGVTDVQRLQDECADVLAIIMLVSETYTFDEEKFFARTKAKHELFRKWHDDPEA